MSKRRPSATTYGLLVVVFSAGVCGKRWWAGCIISIRWEEACRSGEGLACLQWESWLTRCQSRRSVPEASSWGLRSCWLCWLQKPSRADATRCWSGNTRTWLPGRTPASSLMVSRDAATPPATTTTQHFYFTALPRLMCLTQICEAGFRPDRIESAASAYLISTWPAACVMSSLNEITPKSWGGNDERACAVSAQTPSLSVHIYFPKQLG